MNLSSGRKIVVKRLNEAAAKSAVFLRGVQTSQKLGVLFVIAVLFGFGIKSLVHDSLTIGFDDYRLTNKVTVDFNRLQKEILETGGSLAISGESSAPRGGACFEERKEPAINQ